MGQSKPRKIEKVSVVDQVGEEMKEKIISGEWEPGCKLPSESDIAAMYGVNRLSVRMALQKLATLGIIETRVGEGSFVREFSFYPVLSQVADFVEYGNRMGDIREMRYLIERASALKAASECTEEEAEELTEKLEQYCKVFDQASSNGNQQTKEMIDADFALHIQIVKMSGNQLYLEIYMMIQKLILLHIANMVEERRTNVPSDGAQYKEMHIKLCEAIVAHDRAETKKTLSALLNIPPKEEYLF